MTVFPLEVKKWPGTYINYMTQLKAVAWDRQSPKMLASLLTDYSAVFSPGDGDMGRTALMEHSIPVVEGGRPVSLPLHRLGSEKEAEADRQVIDLLGNWG